MIIGAFAAAWRKEYQNTHFQVFFDCGAASSSIWVHTDCGHKLSHVNKQAEVSARAGAENVNQDELWLAGIFSI